MYKTAFTSKTHVVLDEICRLKSKFFVTHKNSIFLILTTIFNYLRHFKQRNFLFTNSYDICKRRFQIIKPKIILISLYQ